MRRVVPFVCAGAVLLGCGDDDGGSTLRFQVSDPTASVVHEFENGDVLLDLFGAARRVRLNYTAPTDELPGVACNWLRPAPDGTELVECAHTYERAPGQPWTRVLMPEGPTRLVGQAKDGTRYYAQTSTREVLALRPGSTTFVSVAGATVDTLEVTAYDDYLMRGEATVNVLVGGALGPTLPAPVYPPGPSFSSSAIAPLVDADGYIYLRTQTGAFDRYALETGARDAAWFAAPGNANPSYRFMGVSSEGALFAISDLNEGLSSGQPDNAIGIGNLMSRQRGDGEWQSEGELFGLGLAFFEQPPIAWPGRGAAWWFSTCIANCAGINGQSQKELLRWQRSPTVEVPAVPTELEAYANVGFGIAVGSMSGETQVELAFEDASCEPVPGVDLFAVVYAICHTPGRHTGRVVTRTAGDAEVRSFEVTVDVLAPPARPVRAPRHQTLYELGFGYYAYIGLDGLVHTYATTPTPTERTLATPANVIALGPENRSLLTADGAVYKLADGPDLTATRVNLPPGAALSGTFMVGRDGNVYWVLDDAPPVPGVSGVVSLACETLYFANRPIENCTALDGAGRTWTFEREAGTVRNVQEHPADPMLAAVTRGGELGRTDQWYHRVEGTPWLEASVLVDFAGDTKTAHASGTGDFYVPTVFVVTRGGEAWVSAFDGGNNFGIRLPPGHVATAIEPSLTGAFVWLDDGRVGLTENIDVQGGAPVGGLPWSALPIMAASPAP